MKRLLFALLLMCLSCTGLLAQNTGGIPPWAVPTFPNASGVAPLALGFVCTFSAGTTTPLSPYQDNALSTPHHNPIQLNAAGRPVTWGGSTELPIYLDSVSYKFVLYGPGSANTCNGTPVGTLIKTIDNVYDLGALFRANFATQLDDKVCHASQMTGANAGAKIAACYSLLPSTGGTIDARGLEGAQTVSSDVTFTKKVTLILNASSNYAMGGRIIFSTGSDSSKLDGNGAILTATAGLSGVVKVFDAQRVSIDQINVDCNSTGVYGIFVDSDNVVHTGDTSITDTVVTNCTTEGIRLADSISNNYEVSATHLRHVRINATGARGLGIHSSNSTGNVCDDCTTVGTPTYNFYIESGQLILVGAHMASASQFDLFQGASGLIAVYGAYSESNKLLHADPGGDSALTTVLNRYFQGVNNLAADVIEFLSNGGLDISGSTIRGNIQISSTVREVIKSSSKVTGNTGFDGTGSTKVVSDLPQKPKFFSVDGTATTVTTAAGLNQGANPVWTVTDSAGTQEAGMYVTTAAASASVYSGLVINKDQTLANLSASAAAGLTIAGKTTPTRELLMGYSTTEKTGWLQTFTSGVAFDGALQLEPQGGQTSVGASGIQYGTASGLPQVVISGAGVPGATCGNTYGLGSLYLRTNGAVGSSVYYCGGAAANAWTALP